MNDDLARAYEAFRVAQSPSDIERARTWDAIAERISRGETGPSLGVATPKRTRRRTMAVAAVGGLLAAVVVGAILLPVAQTLDRGADRDALQAAEFAAPTTDATSDAVVVDEDLALSADPSPRRERHVGTQPEPIVAPQPFAEPEPIAEPEPEMRPRTRRRPSSPPPEVVDPPPTAPSVGEEARLLQRARTALARRDPAAALAIVRDHTQRFPETIFAPERDSLELLSQCALGRSAAVRDALVAFLDRHAGSGLAARVRRACEVP
jgi:hypothetical protein